jgi:hypothetical protein
VGENFLCDGYWHLSTEKRVSGSSSPVSVIYHSNTVLYPNTVQATWTATSLVRTASLNAHSFKTFPCLMFNFKDPKSIIISMLSYMYLRLSSAYSSNLLLPRETFTQVSLYMNHHIMHCCTSVYWCSRREEVSSWDCSNLNWGFVVFLSPSTRQIHYALIILHPSTVLTRVHCVLHR